MYKEIINYQIQCDCCSTVFVYCICDQEPPVKRNTFTSKEMADIALNRQKGWVTSIDSSTNCIKHLCPDCRLKEEMKLKYNSNTIKNEFRHHSEYDFDFVLLLNKYYDDVKKLTVGEVKRLLPTRQHPGFGGTYYEDWMFKESEPTKHYPFRLEASIYDWCGDRSTVDVCTACGNTPEEVFARLFMEYLYYLQCDCQQCENAALQFNELTSKIKQ